MSHYIPDPVKPPRKKRAVSHKEVLKVVGLTFRDSYPDNILEHYPDFPHADIALVREPGNSHDPNAISVWVMPDDEIEAADYHVGYIPKERAAVLAPKMDSGTDVKVSAAAVLVSPSNPENPGMEVTLRYS